MVTYRRHIYQELPELLSTGVTPSVYMSNQQLVMNRGLCNSVLELHTCTCHICKECGVCKQCHEATLRCPNVHARVIGECLFIWSKMTSREAHIATFSLFCVAKIFAPFNVATSRLANGHAALQFVFTFKQA